MQIVGLSGDGQLLVTLTSLGLKFWNLRSARVEEVRSLRWEYAPRDLPLDSLFNAGASAVSSDLKQFAVVRPDYSVELWDIRGRIMRSLEPSGPRRFLRFSPDGKRLVTTTSERSAALWNVESGERIANIPTETSFSSMDELPFEFSADGRTLAVGTVRQILLWDTHSRAAIRTIQFATTYLSFAVSPDSRWLAVGESDGNQVGLYDIATGKPSSPSLKGHVAGINVVQFSPDGQTLFSGGDDSEMRLWHVPTRRPVLTRRHRSNVISGMFSNDGSSLVTADIGQSVHIWRAPSWEVIAAAEAKVPAEDRKP